MKIIQNRLLPLPGFDAINLFGVLFVRKGAGVDAQMLRHERIHSRQMREMLYLPFYLWYVAEWLGRLSVKLLTLAFVEKEKRRHHLYDAYAELLFEREAYRHANEVGYLTRRRPFAWLSEPLLFSHS